MWSPSTPSNNAVLGLNSTRPSHRRRRRLRLELQLERLEDRQLLSVSGSASAVPTASFIKQDTTTQGNWIGTYGSQGYDVIGNAASLPSYATVTPAGQASYTWAASTTDPRALQDASGSGRIAACWYSATSFTVDVNLTDGQTHDLELYFLDWDSTARGEKVQISNASTGAVLNTETVSSFHSGVYLDWAVSGNVVITITHQAGANAVLSGLFFDPPATAALKVSAGSNITANAGSTVTFAGAVSGGTAPYTYSWNFGDGTTSTGNSGNSASFVQTDTTTQGNWSGVYGAAGYNVIGSTSSYPSYATVTPSGQTSYTWAATTSDVRGLLIPGSTSRIAACWYSSTSFTIDVNLTDGQVHPVSLYAVDWDTTSRSEQIQVLDGSSGPVLNTQTISSFHGGEYLTWNVTGNVQFKVTSLAGANAVVSGLFIGAGSTAGGNTLTPSHVYANPGTYTATLTATDSAGHSGSSSTTVTVNDVAPTVTMSDPPATVGVPVNFTATATDISPVVQAAGFTYNWNFGDSTTGTGASPSHTYAAAGSYTVSVTAIDEYGKTSSPATASMVVSASSNNGSTIDITSTWLQQNGPAPYVLNQAARLYVLQTNVTTSGTAFQVTANNITFDLDGHTITYDNATPLTTQGGTFNGGFETGNFSGWNVSAAPTAQVVPQVEMWGNWMAQLTNFTSTQTMTSSAVTIPQANVAYVASLTCGGTSGAPVTLSVVDSVTGAVLGTASVDAGLGFGLLAWFTPTTTDPVVLQVSAAPGTNTSATVVVDYVQVTRTSAYGIDESYRTGTSIISSVAGGSIVQGTGVSYGSYPINAYGTTGAVINGISISASGEETLPDLGRLGGWHHDHQ